MFQSEIAYGSHIQSMESAKRCAIAIRYNTIYQDTFIDQNIDDHIEIRFNLN